MPGLDDLPAGWEIAVTLAGGIGALLGAVAYYVRKRADDPPHDRAPPVDLTPVIRRLDQHERAMAQRFDSLARETQRQIAEKDREDRRQFDRVIDMVARIDRD